MRFGQQRVELQGTLRSGPHPGKPCFVVEPSVARRPKGVRIGESGLRRRERRIALEYLLKELDRTRGVGDASTLADRLCLQVQLVRVGLHRVTPLPASQRQAKSVHNRARDVVLDGEDVGQLSIEPLRPERFVTAHFNELRVDPNSAAGAKDRPLDHEVGPELSPYLDQIARFALEAE